MTKNVIMLTMTQVTFFEFRFFSKQIKKKLINLSTEIFIPKLDSEAIHFLKCILDVLIFRISYYINLNKENNENKI